MDDVVLGCCAACEKKCFIKADNWRELSPEWASQLNIDYEKAHAAAGAGFKGMARLCYNCRTKKTKKPADSGKNGRKGQLRQGQSSQAQVRRRGGSIRVFRSASFRHMWGVQAVGRA